MKINDIMTEAWSPDKEYPDTEQGAIECFTDISEYKPNEVTKVYPDPYTSYVWAVHTNTKRYGPQKHVVWVNEKDFATDDRSGEEDFRVNESTTAGSIATVAAPMTTQSRNASIYGGKKVGNLLTGKKTNKKYANSVTESKADRERNRLMKIATDYEDRAKKTKDPIKKDHYRKMADDARSKIVEKGHVSESKMKQLAMDIRDMDNGNFKKKYGNTKEHFKATLGDPDAKKTMQEAAFQEGRVGLQRKMTPMQALLDAYGLLISFGTQYLDAKGETPEAQKQLLALVQRLQKDKTLIGLDNKKIEANRDAILKHIHQMMTYAIPILQKYLPAAEFAAKRSQINGVLTAYNAARQVNEAHLEEDDLILVPGQGHRLKSGFIPHDKDRTDHEVEMAKSDLFQAAKNAKQVYELIHDVTEEEGLEGWVQEKIIKANDYLNTIREYLEGKQLQNEMNGGVIAAGGVGEGIGDTLKRVGKGISYKVTTMTKKSHSEKWYVSGFRRRKKSAPPGLGSAEYFVTNKVFPNKKEALAYIKEKQSYLNAHGDVGYFSLFVNSTDRYFNDEPLFSKIEDPNKNEVQEGDIAGGTSNVKESITKVGTYSGPGTGSLKMIRSSHDPKHLMLVNQRGEVIKSHHGSIEDFHRELKNDGFDGIYKGTVGMSESQYANPAKLKALLNKAGLFYSGDRNEFGNNFSSKSGESYDIMPGGNSWRHYSGAAGKDVESLLAHIKANKRLQDYNRQFGVTNEAQSMGTALKNTLAKAEPGSKLDNSIKAHNRDVKNGGKGTLKNAPTGYHFDSKGYCRLGDK